MQTLYQQICSHINSAELVEKTTELCHIEMGQTFRHYHQAIDYICALMHKEGIPNVERLNFPADGTTVYEDKRMPAAWDATIGRLTLCDNEQTVAADYAKHPFHLVKGSCGIRQGGEWMRIITEQQFLAGEDPRNALVILETATWPRGNVLTPILDQGGRGFITDFLLAGRQKYPEALQWVNACTEGNNWHVQCDDRNFVAFSVSLAMGDKIRKLANQGVLQAKVECDGHRYIGKLPAATALIPGKKKEEIWLLAHTFEPLLDDDSSGVIAGIEIAKEILKAGTPEYSLRLVFAMELYGYAAFHANFKGKVIGAANIDSLPSGHADICKIMLPIRSVPFHGIPILQTMLETFQDTVKTTLEKPGCADDMFLSDANTGIPTIWFLQSLDPALVQGRKLWHSSVQTENDYLDPEVFAGYTAFIAVWFHEVLFFKGGQIELPPLHLNPIQSPWRKYASEQVFMRVGSGFPYDEVKIPKQKRRPLPDGVLYGPFSSLLSGMDGKKDLAQIILETEADRGITMTESEIRKDINAIAYLAEWEYLKLVKGTPLTRSMLAEALAELGIKKGDTLLVHASVSSCGYMQGGSKAIINGIMDAVSDHGTALFPAFTRPYIYLGEHVNKDWNYRPYDPADPAQIWVGEVPRTVLESFPAAVRSEHATHSWIGLGALAAELTRDQRLTDPPASESSPMAKALAHGGKVLYIGTGLAPSTFLHYLETVNHAPFLQPAVCRVKNQDGTLRTVLLEKHLPGHRDFYRKDAENCKFFRRAVKKGLLIHEIPFGMNKIQMIDLQEFYKVGMQLWKEDPQVLLCDDPECFFCRQFNSREPDGK